jgi:uncharacterized protein (TIGR02246 family)
MFSSPTRLPLALTLVLMLLPTPVSQELMFRLDWQFSARSAVHLIQSAEAASAKGKRSAEQQAPESIVKNLVLAWNRGDSEAVAGLFLSDGILIIPTGSVIHSRSAIRKRILDERQGRLKESVLSNTVEDVSLVDANTALVRGKYVLDGMKVMGVKTSPEGSYILRQRKHQGTWKIAKAEVLGKK